MTRKDKDGLIITSLMWWHGVEESTKQQLMDKYFPDICMGKKEILKIWEAEQTTINNTFPPLNCGN